MVCARVQYTMTCTHSEGASQTKIKYVTDCVLCVDCRAISDGMKCGQCVKHVVHLNYIADIKSLKCQFTF